MCAEVIDPETGDWLGSVVALREHGFFIPPNITQRGVDDWDEEGCFCGSGDAVPVILAADPRPWISDEMWFWQVRQ